MLRYIADENFNGDIVRGLLRRNPSVDIVRLQDIGLSGAEDSTVLEWAASQGRVVVTHDVTTMTRHAFDRVASGLPMPGVFEVKSTAAVGQVMGDLLLLAECSLEDEWERRILYLPLA